MRPFHFPATLALGLAAALLSVGPAAAQSQKPAPPPAMQKPAPGAPPAPQAPAAPKPYKPVTLILPVPVTDPALTAFRGQLGEIAKKKDRAALTKLIAAKGFFWERENGNVADKKKTGIDNLAIALGLNSKDGPGWDMLAGYAEDPTVSASNLHKGAMCSPADPAFNGKEMGALLDATKTDVVEWGYPVTDGLEVRVAPQASAPVTEKLGLHFIRVMPDSSPAAAVTSMIRVVTPSGKVGYISNDAIAPLGNDQLCYVKEGAEWKIGGYIGAGDAQ